MCPSRGRHRRSGGPRCWHQPEQRHQDQYQEQRASCNRDPPTCPQAALLRVPERIGHAHSSGPGQRPWEPRRIRQPGLRPGRRYRTAKRRDCSRGVTRDAVGLLHGRTAVRAVQGFCRNVVPAFRAGKQRHAGCSLRGNRAPSQPSGRLRSRAPARARRVGVADRVRLVLAPADRQDRRKSAKGSRKLATSRARRLGDRLVRDCRAAGSPGSRPLWRRAPGRAMRFPRRSSRSAKFHRCTRSPTLAKTETLTRVIGLSLQGSQRPSITIPGPLVLAGSSAASFPRGCGNPVYE